MKLEVVETRKPIVGTCQACVFWRRSGDNPYGTCRRFPPMPTGGHGSKQPTTHGSDACGEWRPRNER